MKQGSQDSDSHSVVSQKADKNSVNGTNHQHNGSGSHGGEGNGKNGVVYRERSASIQSGVSSSSSVSKKSSGGSYIDMYKTHMETHSQVIKVETSNVAEKAQREMDSNIKETVDEESVRKGDHSKSERRHKVKQPMLDIMFKHLGKDNFKMILVDSGDKSFSESKVAKVRM